MVLKAAEEVRGPMRLPKVLALTTFMARRAPFVCLLLIVIACSCLFVTVYFLKLFRLVTMVSVAALLMVGTMSIVHMGRMLFGCGILQDLVDYADGHERLKPILARSNLEAGVLAVGSFTIVASVLGAMFGVAEDNKNRDEGDAALLTLCFWTVEVVASFGQAFVLWGNWAAFRLVGELLKLAIELHFARVTEALLFDVSKEEKIALVDGHVRRASAIFDKANRYITVQIFAVLFFIYLIALVLLLELVVLTRQDSVKALPVAVASMISFLCGFGATACLYTMTSVADKYQDCSAAMGLDMKLKWTVLNSFPGPTGKTILDSIQNEHLSEFSFSIHHKPMDGGTLQSLTFKMFLGALLTCVMGTLRG